jgi:signal transduction histidine kinase
MNNTSSDINFTMSKESSDLTLHYNAFLEYEKKDIDKALYYLEKVYDLLQQEKNDFFIKVCLDFCRIYKQLGEYESAIAYGVQAADAYDEDAEPMAVSRALNMLALCYMNKGDLPKSLALFFESLKYIQESNLNSIAFNQNIAGIHLNISLVFKHNKDYDKSFEHIEYAKVIFEESKNIKGLLHCYNSFGNILVKQLKFTEAESYFRQSLVLAESEHNDLGIAVVHNNLSNIYEQKEELDKALEYALKSLELKKYLNNHDSVLSSYVRISKIYYLQKNYKQSLSHLITAKHLAEETASELEIYEKLAETYVEVENYKSAYEFQKKYADLKETVFLGEKKKVIAREQNRFEFQQKEREAELLRQKEAAISEYAERLEASNEELEQFAHVVSHDLREPLRMIKGYLQIISKRINFEEKKSLKEFFTFAIDGADRMEHLIHDVLNMSKVNQEEIILKEIDINDTMFFVIQNVKTFIEERGAEIYYDSLSKIHADQSQMTQLFQNIITNGLKYNESDRPTVWISEKDLGDRMEFAIKDNGIGIPKAYQEKVFQMFQRLNGRRFSGTGIGLATCKRIVERHKGSLSVESGEGSGSTFFITIPKKLKAELLT